MIKTLITNGNYLLTSFFIVGMIIFWGYVPMKTVCVMEQLDSSPIDPPSPVLFGLGVVEMLSAAAAAAWEAATSAPVTFASMAPCLRHDARTPHPTAASCRSSKRGVVLLLVRPASASAWYTDEPPTEPRGMCSSPRTTDDGLDATSTYISTPHLIIIFNNRTHKQFLHSFLFNTTI